MVDVKGWWVDHGRWKEHENWKWMVRLVDGGWNLGVWWGMCGDWRNVVIGTWMVGETLGDDERGWWVELGWLMEKGW